MAYASTLTSWRKIEARKGEDHVRYVSASGFSFAGGQESKGSIDENELERLMEIYLQKKDDKTLVQTKRTEAKT
ncbi:hypothetical protein GQ600_7783 [Phytophthora cactorum]|nr:hypothetical protein GQ600_7783 [Phytophthora cactorum]